MARSRRLRARRGRTAQAMMNCPGRIVVLITLLAARAEAVQPATETARVQQDVRALNDALYNADVETVIRYTHPSVIAMLGGIQSARKMVQDAVLFIKSTGLRVESLTFPRPPDFLEAGGRRFAVIPTLSILSANGQRLESLNFQLGVLEPNSTDWTYVEGSRLTKENVQSLFPGFPAAYRFPPFYRKKL
jgi:hypothetical protein